ncbi:MAG: homoserine dehydrogenase [Thermoplasmata archaeon]
MEEVKVALIGFGNVGRGFCELLRLKEETLLKRYDLRVRILAVCDLKVGSVYSEDGLDPSLLLSLVARGKCLESYPAGTKGLNALETIKLPVDIVVETTWTNLETGEPGLTHVREALKAGRDVVTTNKGPIALAYGELRELAVNMGRQLRFKGTVMSGTPSFDLPLETLPGTEVNSIEGILNGTCNFILAEMTHGRSYEDALQEAQARGYAEAEPSADVEGWDAAAKAVILGNVLMDGHLRVHDIPRKGIVGLRLEDLTEAGRRGCTVKLISRVWMEGEEVKASVAPEDVPKDSLLGNVSGSLNGLVLDTDTLGKVAIVGPGAGGRETGQAVLSDLVRVALDRRPRRLRA